MGFGWGRGSRLAALTVGACLAMAAALASVSSADVTIGANVTQSTGTSGTCGYSSPSERPCTFVNNVVPGQMMTAPCAGTITRFRINGIPKPANHYRLRVVRRNSDGSYTGTATSAQVAIGAEGINEFPTGLPIAAGELIGLDFQDSTEDKSVRYVSGSEVNAFYFYAFPADGGSAFPPNPPASFYYLFNADITCAPANPAPGPAPAPSNQFKIVKLKATTLTLELASAGAVTVTDAGAKTKAKASVSKAKPKPKLLKPSSTSGGPGQVKATLKLTGAAKKTLEAKGKVKVKAKITFTPTGGTASTQTRSFTVKAPKPKHPK